MSPTIDSLTELYSDTKTCASLIGLTYVDDATEGYTRQRRGRGFSYHDLQDGTTVDKEMKAAIAELAIPPAWKNVWICPDSNGHILATGIDERGRKQYIYHPKWRTMRDLIKFYRMIVFGSALPKIRRHINEHLGGAAPNRNKVTAAMLWILDNTYIRIGNDIYFAQNESVGLTTLTDENIVIVGSVVTLSFVGKSGKPQQITFENTLIAELLNTLRKVQGDRLFRCQDSDGWHDITAPDINMYLREITGTSVSAKDFRTWGGTLLAFDYLIKANKHPTKTEKDIVKAIDQTAAILGNTRTVARSSYIHPHLLSTYGHKNFDRYYRQAGKQRKLPGLDCRESELLHFLEALFAKEFDLLKS